MMEWLKAASEVLKQGGVLAYPTEQCFGLGCDPDDIDAIDRILAIKQRRAEQGLIVIGLDQQQLSQYADFDQLTEQQLAQVNASWPGPNTWLIPAREGVSTHVKGEHTSIAVRATAFEPCRYLLAEFEKPLISTSANRHARPSLITAQAVIDELGSEVDYVVDVPVGGAAQPSTITDAISGRQLR